MRTILSNGTGLDITKNKLARSRPEIMLRKSVCREIDFRASADIPRKVDNRPVNFFEPIVLERKFNNIGGNQITREDEEGRDHS